MKIKDKDSNSTEKLPKQVKTNGTIDKKKKNKKKKDNFEVRVPRIIVRNLNFKVNEEKLKKAFEKCSSAITNASIVMKDGQSKGFGFVTFEKLEDAQKAIQTMNGQKMLGRPMAVDWSLPKNVYEKMHKPGSSTPVQQESYGIHSDSKPSEVKEEPRKMEQEEEDDDDLEPEDEDEEIEEEEETPKIRTTESSRDVREHRTLFVRNIPFDATEDDLTNLFSSNGQRRILSCRLVVDPISKHPRGSAFIQFESSTAAEECLNLPFTLKGQDLQADMALGRQDLSKAKEIRDQKNESNKKHDQRNLSLANYGVILNLSELDGNESDLKKRQNLEDVKKQKLKNPLYFISPTRLTIHNLPANMDDEKLRKIIINLLKDNNIPMKDIRITECRVMKKNKEAKKSLGYGFISLSRHELALRVVDLLNNNNYVFGPNRRPIVQFAVENHRALQLKEQRRDRLHAKQELLKNPTNKTLAFESNKSNKKGKSTLMNQTNNKTRLSELIKQQQEDIQNELNTIKDTNNQQKSSNKIGTNNEKAKKKKRSKTKSKGEIRDKLDRIIDNYRNKPQLPQRTKTKWFE